MTTNHPEKLDHALTRKGRVDHRIEFGNATADMAKRLFLRFFPDEDKLAWQFGENVGKLPRYSMAELQGHLMDHRDNAGEAARLLAAA